MVPSLCQCPGTTEKVCNRFLPARDKDPHRLCSSCRGKVCSISDRCGDCRDWDDEMWTKVGEYHAKLALLGERKKERKVKAVLPLLSMVLSLYVSSIISFVFIL